MEKTEKKGMNISAKSFITAIAVIFALMILTYALTFIIPGGEYPRTVENGNTVIDTTKEFVNVEGGLPFWKWILSPVLVLFAEDSLTLIVVLFFLFVIGGAFNSLDKCGLMKYMLDKLVVRFGNRRYILLAVIPLFFMLMGSFIGTFEECVPLVPIVVALSLSLGWDALTGLSISLLATGCGFAAGVCNPFTVGVAQQIAGLPMFSGILLRGAAFVLIYGLLMLFIYFHAKKVERPVNTEAVSDFVRNPKIEKGLSCFLIILGIGLALIISSPFVPVLQDYTTVVVVLMFLVIGIVCPAVCGQSGREHLSSFLWGVVSLLPAALMILMASSVKYTLTEGKILDTILHSAVSSAEKLPAWAVVIFIYLIVLIMNFFIGSGSAKAILMMPLIIPVAQVFGISAQLCVVAYAFGDGFSNVFYPTNAVLLISLGLADVSYGKWAKWSIKFQLANLVLTSLVLLAGYFLGYC